MAHLAQNWFVTPLYDLEYKQYQVLDYVQKLNRHFDEKALFPYFDDLLRHIQNLETLTKIQTDFEAKLSQPASALNLSHNNQNINKTILDLKEILEFAEIHFNKCRVKAEFALNLMVEKVHISQLGLINPNSLGGLVIINQKSDSRIYTYQQRMIYRPNMHFQYKDIRTKYTKTVPKNQNAFSLKWQLLKSEMYCGINTYYVECDSQIPYFETVIPLVKNYILATAFEER